MNPTESFASFGSLELPSRLSKALKAMKFETPTPIQAQAIPFALEGRDLIACAQTGTGKTAAFGIPLISRLLETEKKFALILVPTRELALQVAEVLGDLTQFSREIRLAVIMGGAPMQKQVRALAAHPRIVIATPGRLCDHLQQRTVSLAQVETLVLDEADRMLDMGFAPQLNQILRHLPRERQTLLFSATLPPHIEELAHRMLHKPERVSIGAVSRPVERIQQSTVKSTGPTKNQTLLDEIKTRSGTIIIFARTKHRTDRVAKFLAQHKLPVTRIHGNRTQAQRNKAIDGFKSGEFRIMVATDIAARGIDIPHIGHVINYDLPQVPEDYVHRIGRTARAGAEGEALSILCPEDRDMWNRIQKLIDPSLKPTARPVATPSAPTGGGWHPRRRRRRR